MIKAIIFDIDGVMIDSEKQNKEIAPKKGLNKLLAKAKELNLKTAVATEMPIAIAKENLLTCGCDKDDFYVFLTSDNVQRKKPYPDIYITVANILKLMPSVCLVIESTLSGVIASKAAGCLCIGVTGGFDKKDLVAAGADLVVPDLGAIDLTTLERSIKEVKKDYLEISAIAKVEKVIVNSYCRYSHFRVAAALVTGKGNIYTGVNVENASYGAAICAERSAIMKAVSEEGKFDLKLLVIKSDTDPSAPPCGICRQVIGEFAQPDTPILLISGKGKISRFVLKDLLPYPFNL